MIVVNQGNLAYKQIGELDTISNKFINISTRPIKNTISPLHA